MFKKAGIRLQHGIGLKTLSRHNSLMPDGCSIKLSYPLCPYEFTKEAKKKK